MGKRKILILTERFFPEEFLINDLAAEWKKRGWNIEVLTQVPSYPHDRVFDGYCNRWFQTTREYRDIPVHRVKTLTGYNRSVIRKIVNYLNFALLTSLWSLFDGWRYQQIFIYHTGPLTMAVAGVVLHYICRKPCMIWTQDVWPDTVYAYGFKPCWWKRLLLDNFVRLIYSACGTIGVSSPGFIEKLRPYTDKEIHFIPQWTTQRLAMASKAVSGKRIFTFAGNIGSVQNLEMVVEAFGSLKNEEAELRLVGGGVFLERLQKLVQAKQYRNIVFTGRLPQEKMPEVFAQSDVMIISLKREFAMTLPAKFQAYIAAGKPIFGIITGDTAELIEQYELGMIALPEFESIRSGFQTLMQQSSRQLEVWGNNARNTSKRLFDRANIVGIMSCLCGMEEYDHSIEHSPKYTV